jgi:hypothetical protein
MYQGQGGGGGSTYNNASFQNAPNNASFQNAPNSYGTPAYGQQSYSAPPMHSRPHARQHPTRDTGRNPISGSTPQNSQYAKPGSPLTQLVTNMGDVSVANGMDPQLGANQNWPNWPQGQATPPSQGYNPGYANMPPQQQQSMQPQSPKMQHMSPRRRNGELISSEQRGSAVPRHPSEPDAERQLQQARSRIMELETELAKERAARTGARMFSFALFCSLLLSFALFCSLLLSFALFCSLLLSFVFLTLRPLLLCVYRGRHNG